jgi:hypothetical protein
MTVIAKTLAASQELYRGPIHEVSNFDMQSLHGLLDVEGRNLLL